MGVGVNRIGKKGTTDQAVFGQLGSYPSALGISSLLLIVMAFLPGIPAIPFLFLAAVTGGVAFAITQKEKRAVADEAAVVAAEAAEVPVSEEPITTALAIDLIRLELGYGLLSMINSQKEQRLTDQIKALRRQLAGEMGFVMPAVRIQDNLQLAANAYIVRIKEIEAGTGELRPNMLLVMDPRGEQISLPGEATQEPTFGLPAMWIND